MPSLQDRIALITGSTSGIGRGMAGHFASLGARVVVHGPDVESSQSTAETLRAKGYQIEAVAGDLTSPEACRDVVLSAIQRCGIDIPKQLRQHGARMPGRYVSRVL
jgi:NAD(P)-dependent dehydrogenase (short-subunit alcohol dehydrogenase family)